jgi:tetratricopeptide (TPR) repeat protein
LSSKTRRAGRAAAAATDLARQEFRARIRAMFQFRRLATARRAAAGVPVPGARPGHRRRRQRAGPLPAAVLAAALAAPSAALAQGFGGTVADLLTRGDALLAQGRPNEAIAQYQEARTLCPTPAEVVQSYQGEAQALLLLGKLLPAAALLEEAALEHPEDPRGADMLLAAGQASQRAAETDRAIRLFRAALGRAPRIDILPGLKFQLAQALRLRGEHREALELLQGFEEQFAGHAILPNALYTRAIIHHDVGELQESETLYRALIEQHPGTQAAVEAHFELAAVLADRRRDREAAALYRRYVALAPGSPVAAAALERAGDLLLLRSPRESLELYGLAEVKAGVNPKHALSELGLSRYIGTKKKVAAALSRAWVVAGLAALVVGGLGLAFWGAVRRRGARAAAGPV